MNGHLRITLLVTLFLAACGGATTSAEPTGADPNHPGSADSSSKVDPRTDEELPVAPFCSAGANVDVDKAIFAALAPEPSAAYLSLRRNVGKIPDLTDELEVVAERGQLCGDATTVAACTNAYNAIRPKIGIVHLCFTRGDIAKCVESTADAVALLGHVHSIEEAAFIAQYAGYWASCTSLVTRGKALEDGSFRLVIAKGGDCGPLYRAVINVSRDGAVKELASTFVRDIDICP